MPVCEYWLLIEWGTGVQEQQPIARSRVRLVGVKGYNGSVGGLPPPILYNVYIYICVRRILCMYTYQHKLHRSQ